MQPSSQDGDQFPNSQDGAVHPPPASSSLEDILEFSARQPTFEAGERARAHTKFSSIVKHFEAEVAAAQDPTYNRPALVRLTYEYSRSLQSQDVFLRAFFFATALSMDGQDADLNDLQTRTDIRSLLFGFADHLFSQFFVPSEANPTCISLVRLSLANSRLAVSANV